MPSGAKLPISAWAACQLGGMSGCGGVSSKHSAEGMGGVSRALVPGQALKLCAGVEKSIAPASQRCRSHIPERGDFASIVSRRHPNGHYLEEEGCELLEGWLASSLYS